jgi:type I restriction enzyme R subunit
MGEAETRKTRIDPRLRAAGWDVTPYLSGAPLSEYHLCAIEEYPTETGPADYALCVGGQILGIIEAKKISLGPQNDLTQAARYSQGVVESEFDFRGYRVPFLYSTNGEVIWFQDIRHELSRSRRISRFHTPDALTEMLDRDSDGGCARLLGTPNENQFLRPYQRDANTAIEVAIAERKRKMLVAMATGTGKTYTMVNEVYRLMKSGAARRILFLVDRRALAAQAVQAFASFEPEPGLKFDKIYEVYSQRFRREDFDEDEKFDPKLLPREYLLNPKPEHAFVYVCTIQRMTINLFGRAAMLRPAEGDEIDEDVGRLDIPIHAFDLVIADECHRGYTAKELAIWRRTLEHFDAVKVGLTATPAAHTTAYFENIVYRYEYERAVREGWLVDYDAVAVKSDVRMEGIFLDEGEAVGVIDPDTGRRTEDVLEEEREFDASEIERRITSPDSNKKILEEVRKHALRHEEGYGRMPKTLIFAVNDLPHTSHADSLVDIARDVYGLGDAYVQKITGRVDRPLQRIREFRNRDNPGVVVTVDMLSTGVDIRDLEFIVFLRTVKSRILFEQMLGRGTRKGYRFPDKSHFVLFDCFGGTLLEYFRNATGITAEPPEPEVKSLKEIINDIWQNRDREYNVRRLVKRLQRIDKEITGDCREVLAAFVPDGDLSQFARSLPQKLAEDFTGTMKTLRDPYFQRLLTDYPRPNRIFIVAEGVEDKVESWDLLGRGVKPEDYLVAFEKFVRGNETAIGAISILLGRPRDWSTDALVELRERLLTAPDHFTEENLQRAHLLHYNKALVDIISMVKRAAREEEPLYTAEERVDRALARITAGRTFTEEQDLWLDRIRGHLVKNLSIGKEDFYDLPVFSRHGGWKRADKVFDDQLADVIAALNEAVAA